METPSRHSYALDGATRVFPVSSPIKGDNYCRLEVDGVIVNDRAQYDIVNNSIVFLDTSLLPDGSQLDILVVQSEEAIGQLAITTNIDIVSQNIANVNIVGDDIANVDTVATDITNVNTVATNIADVNTVATNIANVNTVGTNIADVNSVATNMAEVLTADTNAAIATTKAAEAASSASTATTQAGIATTKAGESAASASNALTSENNASSSATVASTQAGIATTKATEAASSATTAANQAGVATLNATSATNSASSAATSASNAATSESNAATSETNAASSASTATTQAGIATIEASNAATSATTATTQASNAATSASNAAGSATAAQASLDEFQGQYHGALSTAPTVGVDTGDLYFDTTANEMRVYDGSAWKATGSAVNGTTNRESFTATEGQTVFTLTSGYDANFADVYLNGVKLVNGVDVDVTSGVSFTLTTGATAGDNVDFIGYGAFVLADHYTKAEADAKDALKVNLSDETYYQQDNILGTVSQSGGVPTGAIIERGSNANGEYVKYADGTLICTANGTQIVDMNVSLDGVYFRDSISFTFPVVFSSLPVVSYACSSYGRLLREAKNAHSVASSSFYPITNTSRTGVSINWTSLAIGRWF
jgi:hypothetical protein